MTNGKRQFMHENLMAIARELVRFHVVVDDDDEQMFNAMTYVDALEQEVSRYIYQGSGPAKISYLRVDFVAEYLWACVALEGGDDPSGMRFRGLQICD